MRIYALAHPREEVLAATTAKTSRSPEPFDAIMAKIDEDVAAGFLDRIFNGFNHASIAEAPLGGRHRPQAEGGVPRGRGHDLSRPRVG